MAGQLYAYRISDFEVILRTRDDDTLGAAVGIGEVASGTYICEARNANRNVAVNFTVQVTSKLFVLNLNLFTFILIRQIHLKLIWNMSDFLQMFMQWKGMFPFLIVYF